MQKFTSQTMFEIINILEEKVNSIDSKEIIKFEVLNPDITSSTYAGNIITLDSKEYIYRGYKAWVDLAGILYCKMLTPIISAPNRVIISFEKLNKD